jgi:hypothetical protein
VRGIQWWNSATWAVGDPDGMVWTNRRTLRRIRVARFAKITLAVAFAALAVAVGTAIVCAVLETPAREAPVHVTRR